MNVWYLSETRFRNRIVKKWNKSGFKYNAGHLNILKYSYQTTILYVCLKNDKASYVNEDKNNFILF